MPFSLCSKLMTVVSRLPSRAFRNNIAMTPIMSDSCHFGFLIGTSRSELALAERSSWVASSVNSCLKLYETLQVLLVEQESAGSASNCKFYGPGAVWHLLLEVKS